MFTVAPSLYEPFADVEEKLLSVGRVVSGASEIPHPIPIHVCKVPVVPLFALIQSLPYILAVIPAARS